MCMFPFLQIPYGKKGGKDFILKSLTERVNIPFKPVDVSFKNSTFILPLELYTQYSFYSSILYICIMLNGLFSVPQFHFEQEKAVFFVQEKQEANAIRSQDKKIQLPNGFKVLVCRSVAHTLPFVLVLRVIENVKD